VAQIGVPCQFYLGFCLCELHFRRFALDGSVLAYVSHGRGGTERENLVDHFDCVAAHRRSRLSPYRQMQLGDSEAYPSGN